MCGIFLKTLLFLNLRPLMADVFLELSTFVVISDKLSRENERSNYDCTSSLHIPTLDILY